MNYAQFASEVIETEIKGLEALKKSLSNSFDLMIKDLLDAKGRVVLTGIGKSGHIAKKISATLASTGTPSLFIHPAEASHGDLGMITADDIVIMLSNSGETFELFPILDYCKRFGIKIVGVSQNPNSTLIEASTHAMILPKVSEASSVNAPTTSTTMMLALGDAIAVAMHRALGFTEDKFKVFHPGGKIGAQLLKLADLMHVEDMPLIAAGNSVIEGVLVMTSKKFGCVGVLDSANRLIGIVTDGDLRRHIGVDMKNTNVDSIMTKNPLTAESSMLASEALNIMSSKSITSLFVISEDGKPEGIVHLHDLLSAGVI